MGGWLVSAVLGKTSRWDSGVISDASWGSGKFPAFSDIFCCDLKSANQSIDIVTLLHNTWLWPSNPLRSHIVLVFSLHNSDQLTQQPTHIAISSDSDVSFNQILNENEMTPIFENKMKSSAVSPLAIIHQNPRVSFRLSIVYASARLTVDVWDEGKLKKMMPWL